MQRSRVLVTAPLGLLIALTSPLVTAGDSQGAEKHAAQDNASAGAAISAVDDYGDIYSHNDLSLGPFEINGKNIFEINRERRNRRLANERNNSGASQPSDPAPVPRQPENRGALLKQS